MADPIIADFFRAQVVFPGRSGLAEDVFVNSFVFRNDNPGQLRTIEHVANDIRDRLQAFYFTPQNTGNSIANYLSSALIAPVNPQVKVYDLGQPPPRFPANRTLTAAATDYGAGALPAEVACCLSYYAGRPLPRRRGRIYVGPLASGAATVSTVGLAVNGGLRDTLVQAATGLNSTSGTALVSWHVLSQKDRNAFRITGGWVDDAFDTQRRRGIAPTVRQPWGAAPTG